MHGRDVERLPQLEAALKDLAEIVIQDHKLKEGKKEGGGGVALMKPLRLALTAKKVCSRYAFEIIFCSRLTLFSDLSLDRRWPKPFLS
jgi:hypothetical protein